MTAAGKITTTAITQQCNTKPGVRILVTQDPDTGALARDKDKDALPATAFDNTVRDDSATAEEPTRHTAEEVYDFAVNAAAGGHGPGPTVPQVIIAPNHSPALVDDSADDSADDAERGAAETFDHQWSGNGGKTWRTIAVGMSRADVGAYRSRNPYEGTAYRFVDDEGRGVPTARPEPAEGFGPVDEVYALGDRVCTVDGTGRTSVGVVVETDVPVFKDGRPVQPWDTAYTVRVPVSGEIYRDTTGLRRESPIEVGQTWTSTNSRGEPSTMTIGSIEADGLVVNGVDYKPRGIALSSYSWAQITSGPHAPTGTVRRCDIGGEDLTGPYWLLHGLGRGWEGDRGAACAYHAGQPDPGQHEAAGPVPRDGYGRAIEAATERPNPVTIVSREPMTERGDVRYRLSNGWFIDGAERAHRRAYRPHKYSAWEPGGDPSGCAALRGTDSSRDRLLAAVNKMLGLEATVTVEELPPARTAAYVSPWASV